MSEIHVFLLRHETRKLLEGKSMEKFNVSKNDHSKENDIPYFLSINTNFY